jgi:hypothetical protein
MLSLMKDPPPEVSHIPESFFLLEMKVLSIVLIHWVALVSQQSNENSFIMLYRVVNI